MGLFTPLGFDLITSKPETKSIKISIEDASAEIRTKLGKSVVAAMKSKKQVLPMVVNVPVSRLLAEFVMPPETIELEKAQENLINFWLNNQTRKDFTQGSYAQVKPPVKIEYNTKTEKIRLSFYYAVYTEDDCLIWPTVFNPQK
jgi:hypothetical protein